MKYRIINLLSAFFIVIIFLSSCTAVYENPPEVKQNFKMDISPDEEYFSTGQSLSRVDNQGCIYNDSWIYLETQNYQRYITTLSSGEEKWQDEKIERWVKMNSVTGQVSSLCLVPSCNHSPGSNCTMIVPINAFPFSQGVSGNWFVFSYFYMDSKNASSLGFIPDTYAYNLQTGELIKISEYDVSSSTISSLRTWCFFEDKLYFSKRLFDYSNTDYEPGKKIDDYIPTTKTYLYEFDFNSKKLNEITELPDGYLIQAATNNRFFFKEEGIDNVIYSCDKQGVNMTKEEVLDFAPLSVCGIYAYDFSNIEGGELLVYNIRTNTKSVIETEYTYRQAIATNDGIVMTTFSDSNEGYSELFERKKELFKNDGEFLRARNKYRYESTALVYMLNFDGSDRRLVFEKDRTVLTAYLKSDKYLCAIQAGIDPENDYKAVALPNKGRVLIDIETGEITPVPYLELVFNEGYRAAE